MRRRIFRIFLLKLNLNVIKGKLEVLKNSIKEREDGEEGDRLLV